MDHGEAGTGSETGSTIGLDARGAGYLLKDRISDIEEFANAIRRVADGGSVLDPEVVRWRRATRRRPSRLTG